MKDGVTARKSQIVSFEGEEVNVVSEICENAMRKGRWGPLNEFSKQKVKTSLSYGNMIKRCRNDNKRVCNEFKAYQREIWVPDHTANRISGVL